MKKIRHSVRVGGGPKKRVSRKSIIIKLIVINSKVVIANFRNYVSARRKFFIPFEKSDDIGADGGRFCIRTPNVYLPKP